MAIETQGLARSFRYTVHVGAIIQDVGFQSVSGIGDETDTFEYREGNQSDVIHEYEGLMTLNEVDLEKGYIYNDPKVKSLIRWRYGNNDTRDVIKIDGNKVTLDENGGNDNPEQRGRMDVTVVLNDEQNNPKKEWVLKDCSCTALEFSDFDAESSDALIQTFTVKPEGLRIKNP